MVHEKLEKIRKGEDIKKEQGERTRGISKNDVVHAKCILSHSHVQREI